MNKVVLQIPVSKTLRLEAEKVALAQGFSSLQEIVRVFMAKLASQSLDVSFTRVFPLSSRAEKKYGKIDRDFAKGKDVYLAKNPDQLLKMLKE
ncbi:MAG: hypothetical protein ABIB61_01805 [Candidatus Shapirobacteria bacterium]